MIYDLVCFIRLVDFLKFFMVSTVSFSYKSLLWLFDDATSRGSSKNARKFGTSNYKIKRKKNALRSNRVNEKLKNYFFTKIRKFTEICMSAPETAERSVSHVYK